MRYVLGARFGSMGRGRRGEGKGGKGGRGGPHEVIPRIGPYPPRTSLSRYPAGNTTSWWRMREASKPTRRRATCDSSAPTPSSTTNFAAHRHLWCSILQRVQESSARRRRRGSIGCRALGRGVCVGARPHRPIVHDRCFRGERQVRRSGGAPDAPHPKHRSEGQVTIPIAPLSLRSEPRA